MNMIYDFSHRALCCVAGLAMISACGPSVRGNLEKRSGGPPPEFQSPELQTYRAQYDADEKQYMATADTFFPAFESATACDIPAEAKERLVLDGFTIADFERAFADVRQRTGSNIQMMYEDLDVAVLDGSCEGGVLNGKARVVGKYNTTIDSGDIGVIKNTYRIVLEGTFANNQLDREYKRFKEAQMTNYTKTDQGLIENTPGGEAGKSWKSPTLTFSYGAMAGGKMQGKNLSFSFQRDTTYNRYTYLREQVSEGIVKVSQFGGNKKKSHWHERPDGQLHGEQVLFTAQSTITNCWQDGQMTKSGSGC